MALAIVQGWHSVVSVENLSQMWNIGLETVQWTLWVTTQHGVRSAIHPLNHRYRADHLHFHHCRLNSTFYTVGLRSKVTSLRGNLHAQVYTNGKFTMVYLIPNKYQVGDTLRSLRMILESLMDSSLTWQGTKLETKRSSCGRYGSRIYGFIIWKKDTRTRITMWNER